MRIIHKRTVRLSNNKTGLPGVYKKFNDYVARISYGGKTHVIGYYRTSHEAYEAYLKTARELGVKLNIRK